MRNDTINLLASWDDIEGPSYPTRGRRWSWATRAFAAAIMVMASTSLLLGAQSGLELRVLSDVVTQLGDDNRFRNLKIEVEGSTVIVTGTVALLEDRREAVKKIRQARNVAVVLSHIKVEADRVEDSLLLSRLQEQLTSSENGHVLLRVKSGFVTVQGPVRDEAQREQILSSIASTPGVVGLKDLLQI